MKKAWRRGIQDWEEKFDDYATVLGQLSDHKDFLEDTFKGIDIVSFKKEMREYIIKNGVVKYKEGAPELLEF